MSTFTHKNATTINEAVSILAEGKATVIAGGTALLGGLRTFISPAAPEVLVNIKTIPGLDYIKEEAGMLKIGALTRLTDINRSSTARSKYLALADAAQKVGTPELRNMGTIAGNICQGVQCWYYRADYNFYNCLRKNPTGICQALLGDNRYNSIFGAMDGCVAVNPSDIAPTLIAFGAKVVTTNRTVDAEDFFTMDGEKTNVLDDDEIVTEIQVPTPATAAKSAFVKFAIRKAFDFPIVNCAALIDSSGGTVNTARICLNAVYNIPRRATEAEDEITGEAIDESSAEAAGSAAVSDVAALTHNAYMIQVAKTLVKRAILACK